MIPAAPVFHQGAGAGGAPFIYLEASALGSVDDSSVINGKIDEVAALPTGGTIVLPAGNINTGTLRLKTRVNIVGQGRATRLVAVNGTTPAVIVLDSASVERVLLRDFWIECNQAGATASGIDLDSTGAAWSGGGTEIVIHNVTITNGSQHGVKLTAATATKLLGVRVRNVTLDGFFIDATDCQLVECSSSPTGRHGLHLLQHVNLVAGLKVGSAGGNCVLVASTSFGNTLNSLLLEGSTLDALVVNGKENQLTFAITSPEGPNVIGVVLGAVATRNVLVGTVANQQGSGHMTHGLSVTAGATLNNVVLSVKAPDTADVTGTAATLVANRIIVNNVEYGTSGSYTPIFTGVSNITSISPRTAYWSRRGSSVAVHGALDADPAAGVTLTRLRMSLPITSNLAVPSDLAGNSAADDVGAVISGLVRADTANDEAELLFYTGAGHASRTHYYFYKYVVA